MALDSDFFWEDIVAEWLRRWTWNPLGFPAQVRILPMSFLIIIRFIFPSFYFLFFYINKLLYYLYKINSMRRGYSRADKYQSDSESR